MAKRDEILVGTVWPLQNDADGDMGTVTVARCVMSGTPQKISTNGLGGEVFSRGAHRLKAFQCDPTFWGTLGSATSVTKTLGTLSTGDARVHRVHIMLLSAPVMGTGNTTAGLYVSLGKAGYTPAGQADYFVRPVTGAPHTGLIGVAVPTIIHTSDGVDLVSAGQDFNVMATTIMGKGTGLAADMALVGAGKAVTITLWGSSGSSTIPGTSDLSDMQLSSGVKPTLQVVFEYSDFLDEAYTPP